MKKQKNKNNKSYYNFMNIRDRQILYIIVGFLGGLLAMSMILPTNVDNRNLFIIVGGIFLAWVGYKISRR